MQVKGKFVEFLRRMRASYWFIPGLMTILAIIASQLMIEFDESLGSSWLSNWGFVTDSKPEGARALLSTIAGSMIGVAGVSFSITIAAVAYASSQFGPRIIDNFMADKGNQVTLGTFISTFIYCLLVLRIVRNGEDNGAFVPHASVFVATLTALASLLVLIYFIHHIPESIHVSKLVASIGHQMIENVNKQYPEMVGEEALKSTVDTSEFDLSQPSLLVRSDCEGHVQSYELEALTRFAAEREILLVLQCAPGDFVSHCQLMLKVYGEFDEREEVLRRFFVIGDERSPTQDILYLSDQLIDIAGRALSPGINDPQTAMLCVNWLSAGLSRLALRRFPSRFRRAEDGRVVVIAQERTFETYADSFYDQLRPYVEKDRNAALHMLERSVRVMESIHPHYRRSLYEASLRLVQGCMESFRHVRDKDLLQALQRDMAQANSADGQLRAASRSAEEDFVGSS